MPIYPLSSETIISVGAALKAGGFKSAASYLSELKMKHVELNFEIPPALGMTLKLVNHSVDRGVGPAVKAPEIPLETLTLEEPNDIPLL